VHDCALLLCVVTNAELQMVLYRVKPSQEVYVGHTHTKWQQTGYGSAASMELTYLTACVMEISFLDNKPCLF
jgi:hypothetical protein